MACNIRRLVRLLVPLRRGSCIRTGGLSCGLIVSVGITPSPKSFFEGFHMQIILELSVSGGICVRISHRIDRALIYSAPESSPDSSGAGIRRGRGPGGGGRSSSWRASFKSLEAVSPELCGCLSALYLGSLESTLTYLDAPMRHLGPRTPGLYRSGNASLRSSFSSISHSLSLSGSVNFFMMSCLHFSTTFGLK